MLYVKIIITYIIKTPSCGGYYKVGNQIKEVSQVGKIGLIELLGMA